MGTGMSNVVLPTLFMHGCQHNNIVTLDLGNKNIIKCCKQCGQHNIAPINMLDCRLMIFDRVDNFIKLKSHFAVDF